MTRKFQGWVVKAGVKVGTEPFYIQRKLALRPDAVLARHHGRHCVFFGNRKSSFPTSIVDRIWNVGSGSPLHQALEPGHTSEKPGIYVYPSDRIPPKARPGLREYLRVHGHPSQRRYA